MHAIFRRRLQKLADYYGTVLPVVRLSHCSQNIENALQSDRHGQASTCMLEILLSLHVVNPFPYPHPSLPPPPGGIHNARRCDALS